MTNSSGGFESRSKKMLKTRNLRCWAILVLWQQLGWRQVMDLPTKWWPLWHINRRPGGRCPMLPDRAGKTNKMGNVAIIGQVLGPAWTLFRFCVDWCAPQLVALTHCLLVKARLPVAVVPMHFRFSMTYYPVGLPIYGKNVAQHTRQPNRGKAY